VSDLRKLGRLARPVDPHALAPFPGHYEGGYRLVLDNRDLRILLGPRVMPLRAMSDGGYIMSDGLLVETRVMLDLDNDGVPHMELVGLEPVRRTVGLDWARPRDRAKCCDRVEGDPRIDGAVDARQDPRERGLWRDPGREDGIELGTDDRPSARGPRVRKTASRRS
jgi:hypothetical protein